MSMAGYDIIDDKAKISHVYTPDGERRKGYAFNLMTKELLNKNLTPLLYTDSKYKASNGAYEAVGYKRQRILINFSCSREKKKNDLFHF